MRRAAVIVWCALSAGCNCGPGGSGLAINVTFEASSESKCAIVGVKQESDSATFESKALVRPKDNTLLVGVERTTTIRGHLIPFAHGFATADCTGKIIEVARSSQPFNLDLPGRQEETLFLRAPPGDAGIDSGVPDSGAVDGGKPDAGPIDAGCVLGQSCDDNNACTTTDQCLTDGGCAGTAMLCNMPGQCEAAPGKCAAGVCTYDAGVGLVCNTSGVCRSDKSCADGGEVFCANAVDDDSDLLTDCADPDCANQTCDAGPSTCFLGSSCASSVCMKTTPVVCTPPGSCFVSTGSCVEGTGCPFRLLDAGAACSGGFCRLDGGCTPNELCSNNIDDDGDMLIDCADPDCNAKACDDTSACTFNTVCTAGVCGGGSICPSASFCNGVGSCGTDGGCQYAPLVFAKCDAGFCHADGTCGAPFPFTPSNFNAGLLNVPDASVTIDCLAEFDSDLPAGNGGFVTWCGPRPLVFTQPQTTGDEVAVLVMPNFDVTDAGALYLTGVRPVVFAVFGNASVAGRIVAAPKPGTGGRGAGGSFISVFAKPHCTVGGMAGRAGDGTSGNNTSGGGGGGAFGLPGTLGGIGAGLAASGGAAGMANGNPELTPLRGGCPGGIGGTNYLAGPALGGNGGGAVQMSVAGSLFISGYVAAPGLGGEGADVTNNLNAGGGGAGSGGGVLLEANSLRLMPSAAITAHGGGGGEGDGDPQGGQIGDGGDDGRVTDLLVAQVGTGGSTRGGKGGNGGVAGIAPTAGSAGTAGGGRNGGGGGGGAAVGRIRLNIVTQCRVDAGIISPLFTGTCP